MVQIHESNDIIFGEVSRFLINRNYMKEYNNIDRIKSVIDSCKTLEQTRIAIVYCCLLVKRINKPLHQKRHLYSIITNNIQSKVFELNTI
jgi:hypothetical protein